MAGILQTEKKTMKTPSFRIGTAWLLAVLLASNASTFARAGMDKCSTHLKDAASLLPLRPEEISHKVLGDPNAEKTIVLIHGLDSAKETFTPVLERLALKYRVVAYDQRGHGQTADRGADFSSEVLAGDLKALLDHLGIGKVTLLGHSLGSRKAP